MQVSFDSKKLQKICNSAAKLRGEYGDKMADKIQTRLLDLNAAVNLVVMKTLPGKCHELVADRKGQLSVHLIEPKRLIFRPDHDPVPRSESGDLVWELVTHVAIIEIVDYHN